MAVEFAEQARANKVQSTAIGRLQLAYNILISVGKMTRTTQEREMTGDTMVGDIRNSEFTLQPICDVRVGDNPDKAVALQYL